jgi:fatty aldehyde-generating acyl-ACP reductase
MKYTRPTFAFLVHLRSIEDVYLLNKYFRVFPRFLLTIFLYLLPDIKLSAIVVDKEVAGKEVTGDLILIPRTAVQMLKNKKKSGKRVLQTLQKLDKRGYTYCGLGALTSVVLDGGGDAVGRFNNLRITNGNALTAGMSFLAIQELLHCEKVASPVIAVVGATGSIGRALTKMIAKEIVPTALHLVGRTPENLEKLKEEIIAEKNIAVTISGLREALSAANVVITATSATSAIVTADMLREGAIVYDVAQPQNVQKDVLRLRPDVKVFDGGMVLLPETVHYFFRMGFSRKYAFSCMAETILLAIDNCDTDFSVGHVTIDKVQKINKIAEKYFFLPAPPMAWKGS